jgi:hypothetical protein
MRPSHSDAVYLVDTLMPSASDRYRAAATIRDDPEIIEAMLEDERLVRRLLDDDGVLLRASPRLFFEVLLRQTRRDMQAEAWTLERRSLQRVVIFDGDRVLEMLAREDVLDYLATTLASFTRVESRTIPVRVRKGVWRRYRVSDVDVDSLTRFCQIVEPQNRFPWYKRIADTCLFLAGLFPEYIEAQHRYPLSRIARPRSRGALCVSREDFEAHGRAFYRLAAEHEDARATAEAAVLAALSEHFILAEKPLAYLADRYLGFTKHHLFDL